MAGEDEPDEEDEDEDEDEDEEEDEPDEEDDYDPEDDEPDSDAVDEAATSAMLSDPQQQRLYVAGWKKDLDGWYFRSFKTQNMEYVRLKFNLLEMPLYRGWIRFNRCDVLLRDAEACLALEKALGSMPV